MRSPARRAVHPGLHDSLFSSSVSMENGSRLYHTTLRVGKRILTFIARRDPGLNTVWTVEPLLKDVDDLKAYLQIPGDYFQAEVDARSSATGRRRGWRRGIVMVDTGDPICAAASLFSMEDYTVVALTEPALFHRLLETFAAPLQSQTEAVAKAFPGHLWRVYGPEYATEPYLPPRLFEEYVVSTRARGGRDPSSTAASRASTATAGCAR